MNAASLARTPTPAAPNANPVPLEAARSKDTSQPSTKGDRSKSVFREDDGIPEMFRAKLQDCKAFNIVDLQR
jgi:endonuclease G